MTRTYVILDSLQDAALGKRLSAAWFKVGLVNAVDVTGQYAWLEPDARSGFTELKEVHIDGAAAIARGFGIELRDRAGSTYRPDNDLAAMRRQIAYEYKSRFATALVFGLPALALHYAAPVLAGGGDDPRSMVYPWIFELILVGWACLAAGWPILWQGALAAIHLRSTADLLTTLIVLASFFPSAVGLFSMGLRERPVLIATHGPLFYAAVIAIILATLQRWLVHRVTDHLSGRVTYLPIGWDRLVALWIAVAVAVMVLVGWRWGIALALVFPPMLGLGAVNRWSPGWSLVLPVIAFAGLMLASQRILQIRIDDISIEVAASFVLMMSMMFVIGWRTWRQRRST
ncbi:MAG: hypothetical protein IT444_09345 [Phycisphaeraceae bacterium]|nr:hypothetical protein [Phycisphaeraceae bacterium]